MYMLAVFAVSLLSVLGQGMAHLQNRQESSESVTLPLSPPIPISHFSPLPSGVSPSISGTFTAPSPSQSVPSGTPPISGSGTGTSSTGSRIASSSIAPQSGSATSTVVVTTSVSSPGSSAPTVTTTLSTPSNTPSVSSLSLPPSPSPSTTSGASGGASVHALLGSAALAGAAVVAGMLLT